jgi:hypothetical protein
MSVLNNSEMDMQTSQGLELPRKKNQVGSNMIQEMLQLRKDNLSMR